MNKSFLLVIIAEIWLTLGQICFKKCSNRLLKEQKSFLSILSYLALWLGAMFMLVGMLFWFGALTSGELSFVYLLGSIQYILALMAAHFFLQEKINSTKLIGTLLITLGIILTVIS